MTYHQVVVVVAIVFALTGCAQPSSPESIEPETYDVTGTITGAIGTEDSGSCTIDTHPSIHLAPTTKVTVFYNEPSTTRGTMSAGTVRDGLCLFTFEIRDAELFGTKSYYLRFDDETVRSFDPRLETEFHFVVDDIGFLVEVE